MKFAYLSVAATAAAFSMIAGAASAGTITSAIGEFGPDPVTDAGTSYASRVPGTLTDMGITDSNVGMATANTFVDDFEFTVAASPADILAGTPSSSFDTSLSGNFFNMESKSNITSFDITLFQGIPGAATQIDTTGVLTLSSKGSYTYNLDDILKPSTAYFLQADVAIPKGDIGKYGLTAITAPVSAVPEPSTWLLMIGGVAMIGFTLRYQRRQQGSALSAA